MNDHCFGDICLKDVRRPEKDNPQIPVSLSDETIRERLDKVLSRMKERGLDVLLVYADLEHGGNFEYLIGFLPRFEEALLVLHQDGKAYLVLGNENLNKASKARIKTEPVLASYFSLPNQPMQNDEPFIDILKRTGIEGKKAGLVGWKNFSSRFEDNSQLYDVPYYIVSAVKELCSEVSNEASLFIGDDGARVTNNPNEIAHYEYYASLSSDCLMDAYDQLRIGASEMEVADHLLRYGQPTSVVTICAFGERFVKANMYPGIKKLEKGDAISLTIGYRGGLSSRSLLAVESADELPEGQRDYLNKVVGPYFNAIRTWLENIHVGMKGNEMYELIDSVLPKDEYHWTLNPGHTTAEEEWMSSMIYQGSEEPIRSGTLFQTDIIPSVKGYPGTSVESTCCVADEKLRKQIAEEYPELYERFMERREYIRKEYGICLSEDVLPMCSSLVYLKPFAFSDKAMAVVKE